MKLALAVGCGLVTGALLTGAGIALAPETGEAAPAVTTTVMAQDTVWWIDPHETPIGPAVIIAESLTHDGGEAVLTFRVASRAPVFPGLRFTDEPDRDVSPETWTLTTSDGVYQGTSTSTGSSVRFPVGAGFSFDRIIGITIDRYRFRIPYTYEIGLPAEPSAVVDLPDGATVMLVRVLEQRSSMIVQIRVSQEHDDFVFDRNTLRITGAGPAWRASMPSSTGDFQLLREGTTLPDPIPLLVTSTGWFPIAGPIEVDIGGLRYGQ